MKNSTIIRQPPIEVPTSGGQSPAAIILQSISKPSDRGTTTEEYEKAREYLDQLSLRTGGRLYEAITLTNLADAYTKIASELREFYSLGYYPREDRIAGNRTSIKVTVDKEGLVVKTRETLVHRKKTNSLALLLPRIRLSSASTSSESVFVIVFPSPQHACESI